MLNVEEKNIQWVVDNYGIGLENRQYVLGVDNHEELNGSCLLVVYDIQELDDIFSAEDLRKWCDEKGVDEEIYEVDRVTLVRNTQTIKLDDAIELLVENAIERIDASVLADILTHGTSGYYHLEHSELETELEGVFGRPFKIID